MIRLLEPWRTRLLWASVALNLFALGLLVTPHVWRPGGPPPGFDGIVERMSRHLPNADAARFRAVMERERPWYDISRRDLDEARARTAHLVEREPFDPEATRAALNQFQDRLREAARRFDDSLVVALADLSPEGRATLAESFRRRRP